MSSFTDSSGPPRSDEQPAGRSRGGLRTRIVTVLGILLLGLVVPALAAPAAQAAESCWDNSITGQVTVQKDWKRDGRQDYYAKFRWCGENGKVTKFVVNETYPSAGATPAYVDIQPVASGAFGQESFDVYVHVTHGGKSDRQEFTLTGSGDMIVACGPGLVRYNLECWDPDYLDGTKNVWGGKPTAVCAQEATTDAVKKILKEHEADEAARQGAKQLGKKLLVVPGIFKCMLYDQE